MCVFCMQSSRVQVVGPQFSTQRQTTSAQPPPSFSPPPPFSSSPQNKQKPKNLFQPFPSLPAILLPTVHKTKTKTKLILPSSSSLLSLKMERDGSPPNERVEVDLSSSAAVALVCVSTVFCCLFLLVYCHCYCNEESNNNGDSEPATWILFGRRRRKLRSLLALPLVSYRRKAGETAMGCVVCLNEFEDREEVKIIPGCGHVFHPECIDRWLVAHRSCPVCRCSRIFGGGGGGMREEEEAVVEIGEREEVEVGVMEREVARMVRSRSWSSREVHDDDGNGGLRRSYSL